MTPRPGPSSLPGDPPDTEAIRKAMALPVLSAAGAARIAAHIAAGLEEAAVAGKPAA